MTVGSIFSRQVLPSQVGLLEFNFNISVKFPDVDSIQFTNGDDLRVVARVEQHVIDLVRMTNEALEEEWVRLLGIIVPNFHHVVLTSSQKVA